MMSKVIIKSDHQRREMNSVFRQVGGIIGTLQLSSFDLSLILYCMIYSYKFVSRKPPQLLATLSC